MAEGAALEMPCAGNRTGGSNPPLSAYLRLSRSSRGKDVFVILPSVHCQAEGLTNNRNAGHNGGNEILTSLHRVRRGPAFEFQALVSQPDEAIAMASGRRA